MTIEDQDLKGEEITKTIEQSLTSPELLLGLIARNDLKKDPVFLIGLKRPVSDNKMAEEMAKHISAQVRRGTWLIDIKVDDRSPVMTQRIADLLVKEFVHQSFARQMESWEAANHFLLQQSETRKSQAHEIRRSAANVQGATPGSSPLGRKERHRWCQTR